MWRGGHDPHDAGHGHVRLPHGGSGRHATDGTKRVLANHLARGEREETDVAEDEPLQKVIGTSPGSDVVRTSATRREQPPRSAGTHEEGTAPLGGAGRVAAHGDAQTGLGCEPREDLPGPEPVAVGAAGIGGDQEPVGAGEPCPAHLVPPSDGLDRELSGVCDVTDTDPAFVVGHAVDPIGDALGVLAQSAVGEVVHVNSIGFAFGRPFGAAAGVVADQLVSSLSSVDPYHFTRSKALLDIEVAVIASRLTYGKSGRGLECRFPT